MSNPAAQRQTKIQFTGTIEQMRLLDMMKHVLRVNFPLLGAVGPGEVLEYFFRIFPVEAVYAETVKGKMLPDVWAAIDAGKMPGQSEPEPVDGQADEPVKPKPKRGARKAKTNEDRP